LEGLRWEGHRLTAPLPDRTVPSQVEPFGVPHARIFALPDTFQPPTNHPMIKRSIATVLACFAGCLLMGSVVFTGLHVKGITGKWRLVKLYGTDVGQLFSPVTLEFESHGLLLGSSRCGLFAGRWRASQSELRIKDLVPSSCACGELRAVERKLLTAMGEAEQHRVEMNRLVLMHDGQPVALLVPLG